MSSEGKKGQAASRHWCPFQPHSLSLPLPKAYVQCKCSQYNSAMYHTQARRARSQPGLSHYGKKKPRNSIRKLGAITRNSVASNASEIYAYKAKALLASTFQVVDSFRVREQGEPKRDAVCYQNFIKEFTHDFFLLHQELEPLMWGLRWAE